MKTIKRYVMETTNAYASDDVNVKIARHGTNTLSDAELLSVFISSRNKDKSSLELAKDVLKNVGTLGALTELTSSEFCKFDGLNKSNFAKFSAAIELDRRRVYVQISRGNAMTSPALVSELIIRTIAGCKSEQFGIIFMDNRNRVVELRVIQSGCIDSASIYPQEVARHCIEVCLEKGCNQLIIFHSHPSGVCEPSSNDIRITKKLQDALANLDITILDHIIASEGTTTSLAERGLM